MKTVDDILRYDDFTTEDREEVGWVSMRLIYVAGPYRALGDRQIAKNIEAARLAAAKLWERNVAVICPHSNSAWFNNYRPDIPQDVWLQGGLEMLRRCDAIFMLKGWQQSNGAKREWELAKELLKEIIYEEPYPGIEFAKEVA